MCESCALAIKRHEHLKKVSIEILPADTQYPGDEVVNFRYFKGYMCFQYIEHSQLANLYNAQTREPTFSEDFLCLSFLLKSCPGSL